MAGPWEKYQTQPAAPAAGPWAKYQTAPAAPAAPAEAPQRYDGTDPRNGFSDLPIPGMDTKRPEPAPDPSMSEYDQSHFAQGMSGVNEGIAMAAGAPVDITNLIGSIGAELANKLFNTDFHTSEKPVGGRDWMEEWLMRDSIKPETSDPGKQMLRRVAQDVGAALLPVGKVASKAAQPLRTIASDLMVAGGTGAGAAVADQVLPDEPWAELLGSLFGGASAVGAKAAVKKAITPFPASAERQAAAQTMADEGVDLTAGQQTGNKGLKYVEAELGGASAENFTERQSEQFTEAALRRAGIQESRAKPEVIDAAFNRLGAEFDDLAARSQMPIDQKLLDDVSSAVSWYEANTPAASHVPLIQDVITDLSSAVAAGSQMLPGTAYQRWRTKYDRAFRSAPVGSTQRDALLDIRNAMDDAVERALEVSSPDDVDLWRQARKQYANLLDIVPAAAAGSEGAALGLLSPAQLRMAIASGDKRRYYARGQGDMNELVHAGQATLAPLPQSGTAPRLAATALKGAGPVVGALFGGGGDLNIDPGMLAGFAAGYAATGGAGKAMLSPLGRKYLGNQRLGPSQGPRLIGPAAAVGLDALEGVDPETIAQLLQLVAPSTQRDAP